MEQIDWCYQATELSVVYLSRSPRRGFKLLMTVWWNNGCVQIKVGGQGKQLGARKWVRIQLSSSAPVTRRLTVGDETILGVEPHPLFAAISIVWARRDPRQRRIVNQREVGKSVALCVCSLSVLVFVSVCVCEGILLVCVNEPLSLHEFQLTFIIWRSARVFSGVLQKHTPVWLVR